MRFNGAELRHMGAIGGKSTKEGILYVNEKGGKFWNKMDVLSQRWFRLRGNLLFYLKTNFKNSEPVGVYILENCRARSSEENKAHGIVLEFSGDQQIVLLTCDSAKEAKEWINKINIASYTTLRHKYTRLLAEITKRKKVGQHIENAPTISNPVSMNLLQSSLVQNDDKKLPGGVMELQRNKVEDIMNNSLCPVLELALRGVNLQIDSMLQQDVSIWIRLSICEDQQKFYQLHSQTEPVAASKNPQFMKTLSFFHSDNLSDKIRFRLSIHYKKSGEVSTLGNTFCDLSDLLRSKTSPTLPIQRNNSFYGGINVCVRRQNLYMQHHLSVMTGNGHSASSSNLSTKSSAGSNEANFNGNKNLEALFSSAISRTYEFPDTNNSHVNVQEIMLETRVSFHVPMQYLKLCIDEETTHVGSLENVGQLNDEWERRRQISIDSTKHIIKTYHEHLQHITRINQAPFFKASVSKADKELDFVPINLHLQKMCVSHADATIPDQEYDIVTTGATAVHTSGFKEGGLVTLLQNHNSGKKQMNHFLCNFPMQNEVLKTLRNILTLHTQIRYYIERMMSFMSTISTASSAQSIEADIKSHLKNLGEKVCTLISLLSRNEINEAIELFLEAKGQSSQHILAEQSKWEEEKVKANLLFNDVVKHSDNIMNIVKDTSPVERNEDQFTLLIGEHRRITNGLNTFVTTIVNKCHKALALLNLKRSPVNYNILYRRDVAFSHALSILACGVACKLYSNLNNVKFLTQIITVGILVQVESLISTYGSEKGMLEDYIVGVYDLTSVSVQCVCAEDSNVESLLPTIHGSRNAIIIKLHFVQESFVRLPSQLKEGFLIKVCPVFFNIGVNEEQTLAEKFGSTWLQEYVNLDSYSRLQQYYDTVGSKCSESLPNVSSTSRPLPQLMEKLNSLVHLKKNKNVEVLQIADEICHMLNGVRVTSCKSAKDRTAMAVTLEQAHILQKYHGVSDKLLGKIVSCMRSEGTRRENTLKNTGSRKYAFTYFQLMTFPQQYRPPDGTYGKGQT